MPNNRPDQAKFDLFSVYFIQLDSDLETFYTNRAKIKQCYCGTVRKYLWDVSEWTESR